MKEARAELVRIDTQGQAHPIGAKASQRMRERAGAYRILPAPAHVVFMRYTGEDGRRDEADGAVVRLAGEITRPGALCDILGMLAQTGWRGELCVLDGKHGRSLFFEQGSIVGAETSAPDERLGSVMYRFGGVSSQQFRQLNALLKEQPVDHTRRVGSLAVDQGFVTQEQVFRYLRRQIEEVAYAILTVSDGTFFFLDGFDESRLVSRQAIGANALLMDSVTRLDELRYFREKIPSAEYVPKRCDVEDPPSEEFAVTYGEIDGNRSIEELGRITGRGEFAITRDVFALMRSKHVQLGPPPLSGGLRAIVVIANEALRRLHLASDARGTGRALRDGLASFASGAGVYDMLFRNAGPHPDGTLVPEAVVENLALLATGDPVTTLRQMLYDYVGFALFSAGAMLGTEQELQLKLEVGPAVSRLQPPG